MAAQRVIADVRGPVQFLDFPIKPGETFVAGDYVVLTSTGVSLPVSGGNNYANPSSNAARILGRAESPAVDPNTGALNPFVTVAIAKPGVVFKVPLWSGTPASAVPTITQIGTAYVLRNSNSPFNGAAINIDSSTNPHAYIVDFDPEDMPQWPTSVGPGTTQYANVWIEFLGTASLLTGAR